MFRDMHTKQKLLNLGQVKVDCLKTVRMDNTVLIGLKFYKAKRGLEVHFQLKICNQDWMVTAVLLFVCFDLKYCIILV